MVDEDGALKPALARLEDAIAALCDPQPHQLDTGKRTWLDPLYTQLRDALPGTQGTGGTNPGFAGCWITALELLAEIDGTVAAWVWTRGVVFDSEPATITRLRHLEQHKFRPQDCHQIDQISSVCVQWAAAITDLLGLGEIDVCLNLYQRGATPAACPACGQQWAWGFDAGDRVRRPALEIRPSGCRCGCCKAAWGVEQFQWLARVLDCPLPEGVLE